jgi:hypothetical protein
MHIYLRVLEKMTCSFFTQAQTGKRKGQPSKGQATTLRITPKGGFNWIQVYNVPGN